jgi:predicted Ser/Thr protein kinase
VPCLGENTLLACLEGRLARERRAGVEEHIDACPDCFRVFAELARATSALGPTPPSEADRGGAAHELFAGDAVARYVIRRRVGEGGMGVVYEAHDPALGRKLALKLLHEGRGSDEARARLLREAKAMARLSHPNVVGVHDVGQAKGRVFIAMDFIDGQTLQGWLRAERRGYLAVLDAYLRAGRGLSAAHEAGLVHRDFKPGNVLVGDDGRICVTDFGLVRVASDEGEPDPASSQATLEGPLAAVTRTGALLGSPGYMAPEQMASQPVSAASDVFSYCVSLYAGLYGEPPFPGATLGELRAAILAGEVRPAPEGSEVPGWLRALVVRGLHKDPAQRPPLRALLAELQRERAFQGVSRAQRLLQQAAGADQPPGALVKVAMGLLQDFVAGAGEPPAPGDGPAAQGEGGAEPVLRAARDVEAFVSDPSGAWVAGRSLLYACRDPQLFVSVFWGSPGPEDITLLERAWSVLERPESRSHGSLVDMRRLAEVRPETYAATAASLRRGRALYGTAVRAQAIVRPPGMVGALVSGQLEMEPPPFPFRIFTEPAEALAWLGRTDPALLAELDALRRRLAAAGQRDDGSGRDLRVR